MDFDLRACLAGDAHAWTAFVDRWSPLILVAVRRGMRGFDQADIEDAVQDVFVRLVRQEFRLLRSYDEGRSSMSTWLTMVARSTAIDRARKRRLETVPLDESREAARVPHGSMAGGISPDGSPTGPDIPLEILTPRQRLILRLLFDDGRSVEEAAQFLQVDPQTVRSGKHKALSRLREHFRSSDEAPAVATGRRNDESGSGPAAAGDVPGPASVSPRRDQDGS